MSSRRGIEKGKGEVQKKHLGFHRKLEEDEAGTMRSSS